MNGFAVKAKKSVLGRIKRLNKAPRRKVVGLMEDLKRDQIPADEYDVKRLRGYRNTYRVKLGKLRVVYEVMWSDRLILIHLVD